MRFMEHNSAALVLVLVLLVAQPAIAAQKGEQAATEQAEQEVAVLADALDDELKTDAHTEVAATAPEQAAALVGAEALEGEPAPLPEPEEVLKTKTKSNQSND